MVKIPNIFKTLAVIDHMVVAVHTVVVGHMVVNLEVDQHRRIEIKDVISMLKGLRSEAVIKIVQASEVSENTQEHDINNESNNKAQHDISTQDSFKKSPMVKGNMNLPQIRELNEIAALLRSMDMQQRQISS